MATPKQDDGLKQDLTDFDASFEKWRRNNPDGTFAEFSTTRTLNGIKKGRPHATLGPNLKGEKAWKTNGQTAYNNLMNHHLIRPSDRIVEYGCGSLRVGYHFIRWGKSGRWMGLDVQREFLDYGEEMLGDFKRKKKVQTYTLETGVEAAIAFDPDVVMSTNVANHIHPDEQDTFFNNQIRMVQRPTSVIIVHAMISDEPLRFARSGWAWPLSHYDQNFAPLIRIARSQVSKLTRQGVNATSELLTYQLPL